MASNATPSGNRDVCIEPPEAWDGAVAAQKALSTALRTGQRGKSTDKIQQFGHEFLPTVGVGPDFDDMCWRSVFRQLLASGLLEADVHADGTLKLTERRAPCSSALTAWRRWITF